MKLTVKQNQVLEFLQRHAATDWIYWAKFHNQFVKLYGPSDSHRVVQGLADKGMLEKEVRNRRGIYGQLWFRLTKAGRAQKIGNIKTSAKKTGPIHSTDPRKQIIVDEIKRRTGARKVTRVGETHTHFVGRPFKRVAAGWEPLSISMIAKDELKFPRVKR